MGSLKCDGGIVFTLPSSHHLTKFIWNIFLHIKRNRLKDNFEVANYVRANFTVHILKCILK